MTPGYFQDVARYNRWAHALVKEAGVEPPALDLVFYLRENPESAR